MSDPRGRWHRVRARDGRRSPRAPPDAPQKILVDESSLEAAQHAIEAMTDAEITADWVAPAARARHQGRHGRCFRAARRCDGCRWGSVAGSMEIDFDRDARYWLGVYEIELSRRIEALCTPGSACFDLGSPRASTPSYSRTAAPLAWSPWRPIPRRVRACVATWRRIQGWRRGSRFERAGSLGRAVQPPARCRSTSSRGPVASCPIS